MTLPTTAFCCASPSTTPPTALPEITFRAPPVPPTTLPSAVSSATPARSLPIAEVPKVSSPT